jgi:hypothetical protein
MRCIRRQCPLARICHLEFKPARHLDGRRQKFQQTIEIAGITPAGGVRGQWFAEILFGEPGFVGHHDLAGRGFLVGHGREAAADEQSIDAGHQAGCKQH